jgi:lipid II:glycine glycyltransferase (peptidoglycan interpeptide bridge formation enzyme)
MPSNEPERSDWLARRVADLSNEIDQVKRDAKENEDEHASEISKLNDDLEVAKEEFRSNILRLSSDGFGLELLGTLLLLIAGVFGLLGLI